jgi:G:T-mismatch repair DNA endonuclease (very short patch repair protein)
MNKEVITKDELEKIKRSIDMDKIRDKAKVIEQALKRKNKPSGSDKKHP